MATLVIRHVEDAVHSRLKELAASHGRSMEEEARTILRETVAGLELPEIPREFPREPIDFSGPEWDPPE
jgi:plasmid stability protein